MAVSPPITDRKRPRTLPSGHDADDGRGRTRQSGAATDRTRPRTRALAPPGPLAEQLVALADLFARSQYQLVVVAAEFADSAEWVLAGAPNAARWLADACDIEVCTAREWIRIGRRLRELPEIADAFAEGVLSYSKVRTLTRVATPENEVELVQLAVPVPAGELGRALAAWMNSNSTPEEIRDHQRRRRSVKWRTEPDGMVTLTLRLPPQLAAVLVALLNTVVMRTRPNREPDGSWPTLAQQHADALQTVLTDRAGTVDTEIVLHVRADRATCDDGTPIPDSTIAEVAPEAFIRALVHDADGRPVNASARRRHPTARQKRVVRERDRACIDCGRTDLLEYDHNPAYETTRRTVTDELELRCAPCHRRRHQAA